MSGDAGGAGKDRLRRLLAPRSIALIGAGTWTDAVAAGNASIGFRGPVWRVHPTRPSTSATLYYRSVGDLPGAPDAAFIAVPNREAPAVARSLGAIGCGGFVCFSAGFSETGSDAGRLLTQELLDAAAGMPFLGPNCYGFVNFFDCAALLPDQVVGERPDRGVVLICQSGTIALTLMFNGRSLPIGGLYTVGNQSRLAVEDLIEALCDDPRITAFGLYIEGVKDPAAFARAADRARGAGKSIALVKAGRTAAAVRTARTHTGALAGEDSVFDAFCRQAGLARCDTLAALCETLKLLHAGGRLTGRKILVMGASGGDMAMTADAARSLDLDFAPLPEASAASLRTDLTDRVTVANPFDLHTYLWFDPPAMGRVFGTAMRSGYDAVGFMLDCPPEPKADAASYHAVIDEFIAAARAAAHAGIESRAMLISSLPETISEALRARCSAGGVVPLQGQREALEAIAAGAAIGRARGIRDIDLQLPPPGRDSSAAASLSEAAGKAALAVYGVPVPRGEVVAVHAVAAAAAAIGFPVVLKAAGAHLEHKSDVGGVVLNVRDEAAATAAAARLAVLSDAILVEEMTTDGIAEILIGVVVDPQFGQVLVIGAGGVLTEVLSDSVSLLPPWTRESVIEALDRLTVARLLQGYRGKPAGDVAALIDCILGVAAYAAAQVAVLAEIDVNPVIVRPAGRGVVAVDTMIRLHPHNPSKR